MTKTNKAGDFCALQSIDFCDPNLDYSNSSLRLFPSTPAWSRDSISYAAYSLEDTREAVESNELKLWARFQYDTDTDDDNNETLWLNIRAVTTDPPERTTLQNKILGHFPGQEVLGEVQTKEVFFKSTGRASSNGESSIPMTIEGAKFADLGVGVYDIHWAWQYQNLVWDGDIKSYVPTTEWIEFDRSMHRVFVTVEVPKAPWTASPFKEVFKDNYSLTSIWAEAMFWACKWAQGSKTIRRSREFDSKGTV